MNRVCAEVRDHLPAFVDGSLPGWRRRLLRLHLRGCPGCSTELDRQRAVAAGLSAMGGPDPAPPAGLLDALLEQSARPGVVGRVAVPARGAVSGARPVLSAALLLAGAAAGTGVGWVSWRGARAARRRRGRR
jgi:anti-sigma factor RsiW